MASEQEVRQYLAYWMQLGKRVLIKNGQFALLPKPVIQGDRYSEAFENCWQQICAADSGDCYLEGTNETIAQLLTPAWEMNNCARCSMPVAMRRAGLPPGACPCNDLNIWPNNEIPSPHEPINSQTHLTEICERIIQHYSEDDKKPEEPIPPQEESGTKSENASITSFALYGHVPDSTGNDAKFRPSSINPSDLKPQNP